MIEGFAVKERIAKGGTNSMSQTLTSIGTKTPSEGAAGNATKKEQEGTENPKNLVQKLCEVMASIEMIAKKGENKFHNYKYAKESDIVEAIRGELSKRNLFIFPNVVSHSRASDITDIMVEWAFVDGDSGETRTCAFPGCGSDKSDKGVYKALTGSEKYFLMKTFLIPTGDDPEKDNKDELETARKESKAIGEKKAQDLKAQLESSLDQTACLFYIYFKESNTAEITGHRGLMKSQEDLLKPLKQGGKLIASLEQLEALKVRFEERGVPFSALKAM